MYKGKFLDSFARSIKIGFLVTFQSMLSTQGAELGMIEDLDISALWLNLVSIRFVVKSERPKNKEKLKLVEEDDELVFVGKGDGVYCRRDKVQPSRMMVMMIMMIVMVVIMMMMITIMMMMMRHSIVTSRTMHDKCCCELARYGSYYCPSLPPCRHTIRQNMNGFISLLFILIFYLFIIISMTI
jgi:hypothetical protein